MTEESAKIKKLLAQHKFLKLLENGKVRCSLSGHEFPCRREAIEQYMGGKKCQRLVANHCEHLDQFKEFLELKRHGKSDKLHCRLTNRLLNNEASHVERHVEGRRFQRELKRWKQCEENGSTYQSLCKKGRSKKEGDGGDDDDEEKDGAADDMSDLYPDETTNMAIINEENGLIEDKSDDDDEGDDDEGDDDEGDDDGKKDKEEFKKVISEKPQLKRKNIKIKPSKEKRIKKTK